MEEFVDGEEGKKRKIIAEEVIVSFETTRETFRIVSKGLPPSTYQAELELSREEAKTLRGFLDNFLATK